MPAWFIWTVAALLSWGVWAVLVNTLDPEAIVVGGGLGLSEGEYWNEFITTTRQHIWWEMHRSLPIFRAATGTDAGWLGAAAKAWKQRGK